MIQTVKSSLTMIQVLAAASLSGCVIDKHGPVLATVGPQDQSAFVNSTNGALVVYSAYDVNASFNNRDSSEPVYSDYDIFSSNGNPLPRVHNNSGTLLQDPLAVELTPGKYNVLAFANGYVKKMLVPVIIEAGRTTIVHLEGGGFWPDESAFNQTNAVRLPDGVIVGWKASN
jgi:hypothetical protein